MDKFELKVDAAPCLVPMNDSGEAERPEPANPFLADAGGPRSALFGGLLFLKPAPVNVELIKRVIEGLKLL